MKVIVVGAGAWGLPTAAELVRRGHSVTLIDRHGPANHLSSSPGPTRIWRLAHPDRVRVRLALRSVDAMQRLAERAGEPVFLRRGILWRDDETVGDVASALAAEGVDHELVEAADVGAFLPGLIADDRAAVWQPDAGPVLAAVSMAAQERLFVGGGGELVVGSSVVEVTDNSNGVVVIVSDGRRFDADAVVLAPGPGASPLLAGLGLDVPLHPRLEQVVHFSSSSVDTDAMPCWFEGPVGSEPGLYAMATPGAGYKVGLDRAVRDYEDGDLDRTPDADDLAELLGRIARQLPSLDPTPRHAQMCSWTESPDNRFIIDRLPSGVVIACGDGGEGFKFSAVMGEVLADLAEGVTADADIATFGLHRFAGGYPDTAHVLGR